MSVISEHLMLSQEDLELEANLGYIESSRLAWAIETWDSLSEPRGAGIDAKSKRNLLFQHVGVALSTSATLERSGRELSHCLRSTSRIRCPEGGSTLCPTLGAT